MSLKQLNPNPDSNNTATHNTNAKSCNNTHSGFIKASDYLNQLKQNNYDNKSRKFRN